MDINGIYQLIELGLITMSYKKFDKKIESRYSVIQLGYVDTISDDLDDREVEIDRPYVNIYIFDNDSNRDNYVRIIDRSYYSKEELDLVISLLKQARKYLPD